ncbi:F0F1 ATP synthase subunit gamma, partial [Planococcus sp. SIMBA_143]
KERHSSNDEFAIIALGRVGADFFRKKGYNVMESVVGLPDQPNFADIKDIANKAVSMFSAEAYDELYMFYNHYVSAIQQDVTEKKVLPLTDLTPSGKLAS